jgi:DNA invertase Pin-like site-specific DNA recombinase
MLYHIESVIRRLKKSKKGLVTEKELLRLATPPVNNIEQTIELLQNTLRKGFVGSYCIDEIVQFTGISRRTLYRWLGEGMIRPDETGKVNISEILKVVKMIKKRKTDQQ